MNEFLEFLSFKISNSGLGNSNTEERSSGVPKMAASVPAFRTYSRPFLLNQNARAEPVSSSISAVTISSPGLLSLRRSISVTFTKTTEGRPGARDDRHDILRLSS